MLHFHYEHISLKLAHLLTLGSQHTFASSCCDRYIDMATITRNDAEQASDTAQLWRNAVEDYEKRTKKSLHGAQSSNIELIMEKMENRFQEFRHDKLKADKVRNAFRNNLSLIQKMANAVQIAGGATSV